MIQSDAAVFLWISCLLLLLPLDWLLAALLAALLHEVCHITVLLLLGGTVRKFRISLTGCELDSTAPGNWQAICSILAGPAGSLLLMLFFRTAPKVAVCGLFHGLYNLLPLFPLDGGRMLQLLLYRVLPQKADTVLLVTGRVVCAVILLVSVSFVDSFGIIPVIIVLIWILRYLPRKIPCKPPQIKVQ